MPLALRRYCSSSGSPPAGVGAACSIDAGGPAAAEAASAIDVPPAAADAEAASATDGGAAADVALKARAAVGEEPPREDLIVAVALGWWEEALAGEGPSSGPEAVSSDLLNAAARDSDDATKADDGRAAPGGRDAAVHDPEELVERDDKEGAGGADAEWALPQGRWDLAIVMVTLANYGSN